MYRSSFTRYFYKYYNRGNLTVEHDISLGYADYLHWTNINGFLFSDESLTNNFRNIFGGYTFIFKIMI